MRASIRRQCLLLNISRDALDRSLTNAVQTDIYSFTEKSHRTNCFRSFCPNVFVTSSHQEINLKISRVKNASPIRINVTCNRRLLLAQSIHTALNKITILLRLFRSTETFDYYFLVSIKKASKRPQSQRVCVCWPIRSFPRRAKYYIINAARHKSIENDHLAMKSAA